METNEAKRFFLLKQTGLLRDRSSDLRSIFDRLHLIHAHPLHPRSNFSLILSLVFFLALLVAGLLIYKDYGVAWDESTQVELGLKTYRYVMKGDPALLSWRDRAYGPFFEILLVMLQRQNPSREMIFSRHLLNFLCFFAGCLGFYALALRLYRRVWLALLGCLFLVLSPRIFADAFYNSKDIPFLVLYIFCLLTLLLFLDRPGPLAALVHGLFTAALLATRLPGLVIPALTAGGLLIEVLARRLRWANAAGLGLLSLAAALGGLVLFWPALWPDPPRELLNAFQMMRGFPHLTGMLYLGQQVTSQNLPWHYIPVWIAVATPPLYLGLFTVGGFALASGWLRAPRCLLEPRGRGELIVAGALALPILAVILLRSTLYDGWRQMYFVYPAFLLVALRGVYAVHTWLTTRRMAVLSAANTGSARWRIPRLSAAVLSIFLLAGILPVAAWMAVNHPYENLYFNRLAGPDMVTVQRRFSLDYWGLAYRGGLAYLLAHDSSARIPVFVETTAGQRSAAIFPTEEEKRLDFVSDLSQAKYYLGNFYNGPGPYPFKNEVYSVRVGNAKILAVYLLSEDEKQ